MTGHCNQNGAIKQPPRCTKSCCFLEIFFCPHRFRIPTEPVPAPSGRCVVGHDLSSDAIRAGPRLQRQRLSRFPDTCCILRGEHKCVTFCFVLHLFPFIWCFCRFFLRSMLRPCILHSVGLGDCPAYAPGRRQWGWECARGYCAPYDRAGSPCSASVSRASS